MPDPTLREALDWCCGYIEGTRDRTRPPEGEPFLSQRLAEYRAAALPDAPREPDEFSETWISHPETNLVALPAAPEPLRDHETCVPHGHVEPDPEKWERDQAASLPAAPEPLDVCQKVETIEDVLTEIDRLSESYGTSEWATGVKAGHNFAVGRIRSFLASPVAPKEPEEPEPGLREALELAEDDAPEEAAHHHGPTLAAERFLDGARWALNRWSAALRADQPPSKGDSE